MRFMMNAVKMLVGVAVVCLAAGCLTCGGRTELPSGFVHVTERVPDAILEIRYHSTYNFVGKRIDGYDAPEAILTEKAAAALRKASDALKERGYRLKIYDAYRPQRAVDHFMRWAADRNDVKMSAVFDGTLKTCTCGQFDIRLPKCPAALNGLDLSRDRSDELKRAEAER